MVWRLRKKRIGIEDEKVYLRQKEIEECKLTIDREIKKSGIRSNKTS